MPTSRSSILEEESDVALRAGRYERCRQLKSGRGKRLSRPCVRHGHDNGANQLAHEAVGFEKVEGAVHFRKALT